MDCHVGCIVYADDLLLISLSVLDLQRMLDLCSIEGNYLGIKFNYKKSNFIYIGPRRFANLSTLYLSGMPLACVEKIKYIGVYIIGGKSVKVDTNTTRRDFFAGVNGILSKYPKASDISKLFLCETHCLPILMYAIESINLSVSQCNEMNSWRNPVYHNIFHFNKWDSVTELFICLKRLDFKSLY